MSRAGWWDAATLAILPICAWLTLFHQLGASTLNTDPHDEAVHAGVTVEMARTGSWSPTFHGVPYHGKPPLKMWLAARLVRVLGPGTTVLRAIDAVAALLAGVLLWLLTRPAFGPAAGLLAPICLWTSPHFVHLHGAREGVQDSFVTFLFSVAIAGWMLAADRDRWWFLLPTAAMVAALFVKSVVGLLPAGIAVAIHVVKRGPRGLLDWRLGVGIAAVLFVFWAAFGGLTPYSEIRYNVYKRAFHWPKHQYPWYAYVLWLRGGLGVWYVPFLAGVALAAGRALRRPRSCDGLETRALLWVLGVLVPFSIATSKLPWYLYPMYPAAAILAARVVAPPEVWRAPGRLGKAASLAAMVLLGGVGVFQAHVEARKVRTSISVGLLRAARSGARTPLHLLGIPREGLCPDEVVHLEIEGFDLRPATEEEVVRRMAEERGLRILTTDEGLDALARRAGGLMGRARVARFGGACEIGRSATDDDPGDKRKPPRRVLLVMDGEALPEDFARHAPVRLGTGFYAAEPFPGMGQMQWMAGQGSVVVGAEGRLVLRFKAQAFHRERTLRVVHGGRVVLERRVKEWSDLATEPFDAGPGGAELSFSTVEGCDEVRRVVPESGDRRCLSVAIAAADVVAAP